MVKIKRVLTENCYVFQSSKWKKGKKSIVIYSWVSKLLEQNMYFYVSEYKLIGFH